MDRDSEAKMGRRQLLHSAAGAIVGSQVLGRGAARAEPVQVFDYDVAIIGSGAAGMTAALVAAKRGLRTLVIEKAGKFGGSTARSGAGIWIPNNEIVLAAGVPDSKALAAAYLAAVVGGDVARDRQAAFLDHGPAMISFVMRNSPLRFRFMEGYPDYYPERTGGMPHGRSIEPDMFDGNLLGEELAHLNPAYMPLPDGVVVFGADYKWLTLALVNAKGAATAVEMVARYGKAVACGKKPLTMGQALAGGLRAGLLSAGVPVWLNSAMLDVKVEGGRVTGVLVQRDGASVLVRAKRGVIVASGGFERDLTMRTRYQEQPIGVDWTMGATSNTGDGIRAGLEVGAAVALMDDAWWGPTIPLPEGPYFCLSERTLPGSIMVDAGGKRFVNEAAPYSDVVHTMYQKGAVPAWMVVDQNYRNRYLFRDLGPLLPFPASWYENGSLVSAVTLAGLAAKMGVPPDALEQTIARFNGLALAGTDVDFHRGDSAYDHYFADPAVCPNSCLAPLSLPPFHAFKIVPGDLGTKGGLVTDAAARVLTPAGAVIPGLYAAGNASAAVMGHSYAGAGSTIGPAMTFGFIAANGI
ncbi:3-oxosteroid 1-dehydrogenase [Pendulispora brunnea]|uniref:3-oxosteroid 1-dehydrogenase n=1 Tax=Pendulispora brunnea TaxID=2905690 RepID=A0ABZ2JW59_9BACT